MTARSRAPVPVNREPMRRLTRLLRSGCCAWVAPDLAGRVRGRAGRGSIAPSSRQSRGGGGEALHAVGPGDDSRVVLGGSRLRAGLADLHLAEVRAGLL